MRIKSIRNKSTRNQSMRNQSMRNKLLRALPLLAACMLPACAQLVLQSPHPLPLHAGSGAVTFRLTDQNAKDPAPIPLALSCGPVIDTTTHALVKNATATLAPVLGGPALPTSIAPGQTVWLIANVTGLSGVSTAELPIFNAGSHLGTLQEFASDAALGISVDADGSSDNPLSYRRGSPVSIALKNADAEPYHLHWSFQIDNQIQSSGDLDMPPGGSARIPITPSDASFSFFDRIQPSHKKGILLLSLVVPGVPAGLLPARSLPVWLVMQPASPFVSTVFSYLYVVILLLIGGMLSFLGSSLLPNMQKKGELRSQLQDLANRTSLVSTRIDSYLRVLLRLERSRIANLIDDAPAWVAPSADPLVLASSSVSTLSKRLAAAERLDDLRRKHAQIAGIAPPSVTDGIDANLQAAADQLHSTALSDVDLAAANASFAKAQAALDLLNDTDALSRQIAGNVSVVMTRLAKFPPNYFQDLKQALPGVFIIADPTRGYNDPNNIVRPMLFAIDHGAAAIQLALDYAMVRASIPVLDNTQPPSTPSPPPAPGVDATPALDASLSEPRNAAPALPRLKAVECIHLGEKARERLLKRQCVLIELLGTLSWRALRDGALLLQEMREDTYEEDVLREISKQRQAEITFDTQRARPFRPVFFFIKFKDERFNNAAALQRLICHWTFPSSLEEFTWNVCHYFTGEETDTIPPPEITESQPPQTAAPLKTQDPMKYLRLSKPPVKRDLDIYATIRGQRPDEGRELPAPPLKKTVTVESSASPEHSLFWAGLLRFAIAFGVALAGLLSGALEQLQKLDIVPAAIAIIGLGFSASSVKNLLTQSTPLQPPAPLANPKK
jgi:hypothetical protein